MPPEHLMLAPYAKDFAALNRVAIDIHLFKHILQQAPGTHLRAAYLCNTFASVTEDETVLVDIYTHDRIKAAVNTMKAARKMKATNTAFISDLTSLFSSLCLFVEEYST